jgi:hypothetical protein
MAFDHLRVVAAPYYEHYFLHVLKSGYFDCLTFEVCALLQYVIPHCFLGKEQEGSIEMVPVLPWLEADGKENPIRRAALHRRIMGIVMLNPGILEVCLLVCIVLHLLHLSCSTLVFWRYVYLYAFVLLIMPTFFFPGIYH